MIKSSSRIDGSQVKIGTFKKADYIFVGSEYLQSDNKAIKYRTRTEVLRDITGKDIK